MRFSLPRTSWAPFLITVGKVHWRKDISNVHCLKKSMNQWTTSTWLWTSWCRDNPSNIQTHSPYCGNRSHIYECAFAPCCPAVPPKRGNNHVSLFSCYHPAAAPSLPLSLSLSVASVRSMLMIITSLKSSGTPFLLSFPLMKTNFHLKQMQRRQIQSWVYWECLNKLGSCCLTRVSGWEGRWD